MNQDVKNVLSFEELEEKLEMYNCSYTSEWEQQQIANAWARWGS